MISGYETSFSYIHLNYDSDHFLNREFMGFLRPIVPLSVIFASISRGLIEAPFEYAKLMGQTEKKWVISHIYRGLHWQLLRTTTLLMPVYTLFDLTRRKSNIMQTLAGNMFVTFGVVGVSYLITWPLETLKNLAQTGIPRPRASVKERVRYMGGISGLMRGVSPGALSGGGRNAFGMVAMVYTQQFVTSMGWRDNSTG
eukprot:CAMPEP_0185030948 /NCGR_PEP_ID=MMETSP1103-20130426/18116_1 /TAXON_ID=36769 /ORGANISM="Paraphysomonas bandaiensis, Strain Caron Lab Isolate" /LENGTH=197 /DNA_ID=CAMNT_0027566265 /DNA_START=267 /DNA_END=860 /DNA_ORIENTATION=-